MPFLKTPQPQLLADLDSLINLLKDYQGEPILADKHPIHIAVQLLERDTCQTCGWQTSFKPGRFVLPGSMRYRCWAMFWASREGVGNPIEPEFYWYAELIQTTRWRRVPTKEPAAFHASPYLAMLWRDNFVSYLKRFREIITSGEWEEIVATNNVSHFLRLIGD